MELTVLIPTYNSERHLRACLESVKWASEILICDSYSSDSTLEIVREYTDRIIQHEYINSANQKNWAIPQAAHEWILVVDSDEYLEAALQDEIHHLLANMPDGFDGFRIPRKNLVFGKWVSTCNMYPDYNVRLFRRACRYAERDVHADVMVPGGLGTLKNSLVHHDFEDLVETVAKWSRYTRYEGDRLVKAGRRWRWTDVVIRPIGLFFYMYFWKQGFRDGFRGYFIALMWAIYTFFKYARLWQLTHVESPDNTSPIG